MIVLLVLNGVFFQVWYIVFRWLGWEVVMPSNLVCMSVGFGSLKSGARINLDLTDMSVVLLFYKFHNESIFSSEG